MRLPSKVVVGDGIMGKLSEVFEGLARAKRIIITTDTNILRIIGCKLEANWDRNQVVETFLAGEASMEEVKRLEDASRRLGAEIILGVGGGRVIDIAKMASYRLGLSFVSVPTAASHDGISSQFASLRGGGKAYSYMANPPVAIIVDIDVMLQAPRRLARSGLGDAISKIIAVRDWRLAHERTGEYYGEYAAQLALMAADVVKGYAEGIGRGDREGTRTLVEALISDGVAAGIAGSSRPCSGSEHLFSHSLDIHSSEHALHGEQCGVGSIIMAYLHGLDVGDIRDTLKIAGAPINAYDLGISEGNIVKALSLASMVRPERYTILNEVELDEERAREVARAVEVI